MPPTSEKTPEDDGSKNMVSNLPLVFADGYPTSLDKITEAQLEKFIPFMVQCSLGNVTIEKMTEFNKPAWWPKDLEFMKPFKRPKSFVGDWLLKMRELVVACYNSHDNIYLLRYCADLAKFQPTALRFINNYNSTTSLYERSSNKLLVTFRNENMMYDQQRKMNSRKCLLPKQSNSQTCLAAQEEMVISECFDIYLCDNCDAELYSAGAMKDHERYCNAQQSNAEQEETSDDDDVIFCGTVPDDQLPLDSAARAQSKQQKMVSFLAQNFMLRCANTKEAVTHQTTPSKSSGSNSNETDGGAVESGKAGKQHRVPRRSRQVVTLAKSTTIPLSSPLGLFLLKTSKIIITPEYLSERFDRMERFCAAPALPFGTSYPLRPSLSGGGLQEPLTTHDRRLPKWLFGKVKTSNGSNGCPVTFKRVSDDSVEPSQHQYKFPRRQLSTKHRVENFLFYNKLLLQRCRSCVVGIERLTIADVQELALLPGIEREQREADEAARLERQRRKEIAELAESAMVIDSIDLCSSDEDIGPEFSTVENAQHTHECSSYNNYIAHDAIETIIIEKDDSSDTNEFTNTNPFYVDVAPEQSFNTGSSVLAEMVPKIAKKSFIGAMLSESTYRLNQSLPAGHGRAMEGARQPLTEPLYLYAHCSQAVVNGSEEAQFSSGNRLIARKSTSLPLKENLVHGFGSTGTNSANGESLLAGTGSQCAATPVPMHQAAVQSRTVLLTGAVTNGHAIIGTIPVSFGSGSNLHSRANASVVQTLSTATYASQTIHSHASINHSNGPSAAAIPSPPTVANLQ
uniref:Nuclear respiratory factor 1 NLS/DNA-binding dimerisation domain-containing protein n=1 Tax=Anopheles minimus TaxID=112268 RepID=A0A182VYG2_9DIPT